MKKEIILRKLTSRKFWMALVGVVSGLIIMVNGDESAAQTIGGIITEIGSIVAYILGESWSDSNHKDVVNP